MAIKNSLRLKFSPSHPKSKFSPSAIFPYNNFKPQNFLIKESLCCFHILTLSSNLGHKHQLCRFILLLKSFSLWSSTAFELPKSNENFSLFSPITVLLHLKCLSYLLNINLTIFQTVRFLHLSLLQTNKYLKALCS